MNKASWPLTATRIRTAGFILAMIPMMLSVALLTLFALFLLTPLTIYAGLTGKHLKDPWRKHRIFWEKDFTRRGLSHQKDSGYSGTCQR